MPAPARGRAQHPVYIGLANEDGLPPPGTWTSWTIGSNPETGTIRARAVFSNKERLFTPGLFARVKLVGSGRYRAVLVQDRAVGTDQDKKFLLVLKSDNTVEYRAVELGRAVEGLRVIKSGVKAGERVVINGLQRVRPGMKVTPKTEPMAPDSVLAKLGT